MSFQPKVYTLGHVLFLTAGGIYGTVACYRAGIASENPGVNWFAENWMLYIGAGATIVMFLVGLTMIGTPCYDEETNSRLKAEHDQAEFEWNRKSPEERAILNAARQNELLQLTQILQNSQIIRNQDQAKPERRY